MRYPGLCPPGVLPCCTSSHAMAAPSADLRRIGFRPLQRQLSNANFYIRTGREKDGEIEELFDKNKRLKVRLPPTGRTTCVVVLMDSSTAPARGTRVIGGGVCARGEGRSQDADGRACGRMQGELAIKEQELDKVNLENIRLQALIESYGESGLSLEEIQDLQASARVPTSAAPARPRPSGNESGPGDGADLCARPRLATDGAH